MIIDNTNRNKDRVGGKSRGEGFSVLTLCRGKLIGKVQQKRNVLAIHKRQTALTSF